MGLWFDSAKNTAQEQWHLPGEMTGCAKFFGGVGELESGFQQVSVFRGGGQAVVDC